MKKKKHLNISQYGSLVSPLMKVPSEREQRRKNVDNFLNRIQSVYNTTKEDTASERSFNPR